MISQETLTELKKIKRQQEELTKEIVNSLEKIHGNFVRELCEHWHNSQRRYL